MDSSNKHQVAQAPSGSTSSNTPHPPNSAPPEPAVATAPDIYNAQALDPAKFLHELWPSPNLVHQVGLLKRPGNFRNTAIASVEEALIQARAASDRGDDAYFAMAEYANANSRKADNVVCVSAFWVDVDCGPEKAASNKGYATADEARSALKKFRDDCSLPAPTHMVDSGAGLHLYWVLSRPLDAATWKLVAGMLKQLTQQLQFRADPSRTADIASVLRVPGTLNYKYSPPRPVDILEASDDLIDTDVIVAAIESACHKLCNVPTAIAAPNVGPSHVGDSAQPIDILALRSALAALDPDCDDEKWKFHFLAPLAGAAREHPDQADALKDLARDFSSGALCGRQSVKWSTPGSSNGRSGKQVFDEQWNRFYGQPYQGKPITIATIFHDAKQSGWTGNKDTFTVAEYVRVEAGNDAELTEGANPGGIVPQNYRLPSDSFPEQPVVSRGPLPSTLANIRHMLKQYGIVVRYNVIKKKVRITIPGHLGSVDNADNVALTKIISLAIRNGLGSGQVPAYLEAIADENLYNPAADWILSKPWDGVDRLPAVYATLVTRDGFPVKLKHALMYRWLLSLVAAALLASGFKGRGVLTLQGPQGLGKTTWLSSLVDDPVLREELVKIDHHLDPSLKDSILGAISHWIVEIGELDSSFRKDMARIKGVLTSDADKIRRPYARSESEYQRRTVFMATVNETAFLVDHTGNSRWWTLPVVQVNYRHGIDMQQVFAQLAVDFSNGAQWWLTPEEEEMLAQRNERHRSLSAVEELLLAKLDLQPSGDTTPKRQTALEILAAVGIEKPSNPQCKEANAFLRRHLGEPKRIKGVNYWYPTLREDDKSGAASEGADQAPDDDGF